jgi:hypothetical protein
VPIGLCSQRRGRVYSGSVSMTKSPSLRPGFMRAIAPGRDSTVRQLWAAFWIRVAATITFAWFAARGVNDLPGEPLVLGLAALAMLVGALHCLVLVGRRTS